MTCPYMTVRRYRGKYTATVVAGAHQWARSVYAEGFDQSAVKRRAAEAAVLRGVITPGQFETWLATGSFEPASPVPTIDTAK